MRKFSVELFYSMSMFHVLFHVLFHVFSFTEYRLVCKAVVVESILWPTLSTASCWSADSQNCLLGSSTLQPFSWLLQT